MVVKIGGVEIDNNSSVEGIEQLKEGLGEIGVDSATEAITWVSELSLEDRIEFAQVVGEWSWDVALSLFSFGLF